MTPVTQEQKIRRMDLLTKLDREFCVICVKEMGFSISSTPVDSPLRFRDGASYDVCGQTCGECNHEIKHKVTK